MYTRISASLRRISGQLPVAGHQVGHAMQPLLRRIDEVDVLVVVTSPEALT
jgi:hypothetical protein